MDPASNKRFQRLVLSAVFTPLLLLAAFIALADGHWPVALGIGAAALLLATLVPFRPAIDSPLQRMDRIAENLVSRVVVVATVFWLSELPEARELFFRLLDGHTLLTAPVLTVAALWALLKAYRNWQILRHLNDREIENYILGHDEIRFQGPIPRKRVPEEQKRSRR